MILVKELVLTPTYLSVINSYTKVDCNSPDKNGTINKIKEWDLTLCFYLTKNEENSKIIIVAGHPIKHNFKRGDLINIGDKNGGTYKVLIKANTIKDIKNKFPKSKYPLFLIQ